MVEHATAHRKAHPELARERRRRYREKKRANQAQQAAQAPQEAIPILGELQEPQRKALPAHRWKFKPYIAKPTITSLRKIPRDEAGNKAFLNKLQEMPALPTSYLKLALNEAAHRASVYDELVQLILRNDPSHQRVLAIS
jgi:hypothetical protein